MKFAKNKIMSSLIALFLILTITITVFTILPTVTAAVNRYTSFVYCSVSPNVIGVAQRMIIVAWTASMPPDIGETASTVNSPTLRAGWSGMKATVTKPDGTNQTIEFPYSDPVGANWIAYTPTEVGTYHVQVYFPEVWKNTTTTQSWYSSALSYEVTFSVQQEPIQEWLESPLPTGYWSRPINGASRDWYVLAGNWLGGAAQQPAGAAGGTTARLATGQGPESAHIMWAKPFWAGGIMDEMYGDTSYQTSHYQGLDFSPPLIVNGKIYYSTQYTAHTRRGWNCVDLYTGETLYYENDTQGNMAIPTFGQIYNYESPNQHGGIPYLWRTSGVTINNPTGVNGTVWEMLDGYTANSVTKIANVTSGGTAVYGKDGSILRFNLVNYGTTTAPNYYLQVWNTSAVTSLLAGIPPATGGWQWRPAAQAVHNGATGFSLNVSIPSILGPRNPIANQTGSIQAIRQDEFMIVGTAGQNNERGVVPCWMMSVSLEPGKQGTKLWESNFAPPFISQLSNATVAMSGVYPDEGVILFESTQLLKRWGYDMKTGNLLWESAPEPALNYYGIAEMYGMNDVNYQGLLFSYGYSGVLLAYNMTTGEIVWSYNSTNVGFESPYGNYPSSVCCIADGKLYLTSSEHSPGNPLWRGPNLRCINASNGAELWKILFWGQQQTGAGMARIADGRLVSLNLFDARIYCFGKGPSATTVSAPQIVQSLGSSVMITGAVTDQTPTGSRNANDVLDFSLKGTPAISDEDMGAWMEYIFMQQAKPENAKGVTVLLTTIDPNGNIVSIGEVTTDINGNYGLPFTPEVPGQYQIIATFQGSKSYGPSTGTTYLSVEQAPPQPTEQPVIALPPTEMYFAISTAAIIAAIVIIGAIIILVLRRRS